MDYRKMIEWALDQVSEDRLSQIYWFIVALTN